MTARHLVADVVSESARQRTTKQAALYGAKRRRRHRRQLMMKRLFLICDAKREAWVVEEEARVGRLMVE